MPARRFLVPTTTRHPERAERARSLARGLAVPASEPRRILSLEPAATEILCALGVGARLVGVSPDCDHPRAVVGLPTIPLPTDDAGALVPLLARLEPDLVVAPLPRPSTSTLPPSAWLTLRAETFEDVLADVIRIGTAAWAEGRGDELARAMDRRLERLERESTRLRRPTVAVVERLAPLRTTGRWMPELVRAAGGQSAARVEQAEVLVVALPGLTVPAAVAALAALESSVFANVREVVVADGRAFFHRPGPRLVETAEILALALHPRRFAGRFGFGRETLTRWSAR